MRSEGMKCFFVSMVVAFCGSLECPDGANCRCFELNWFEYGIYCPDKYNVKLFINIDGRKVKVHCYEKSAWSDFNYYAPTELGFLINDFVIVNCSWPKLSFAELLEKTGINVRLSLTFSEGSDKASNLTKRDLSELWNVVALNLSFNAIEELSSDILEGHWRLRELNFSSNRINVLPPDVFNLSTNLTSIDLSDNNITRIDEMLFRNLSRLDHLSLMKNRLKSLQPRIFDGLTSLRNLNLAKNELSSLSKHLFECLSNLQTLDISDNDFLNMDDGIFANNTKLIRVYSSNNRGNIKDLFAFFKFLSSLDKAEELTLMGNNLDFLPTNIFQKNTRLKQLNLSSNAMETLPANIFKGLREMTILDISANQLNDLPQDIFVPLVNLKELYLQRNKLTSVFPNYLDFGTELRCPFKYLSFTVYNFSAVYIRVGIRSTVIFVLNPFHDQSAFRIPTSVEIFNVNYNRFVLLGLPTDHPELAHQKLRVLRLSHNHVGKDGRFRYLFGYWFPKMYMDIQEIYLDHNEIDYFRYSVLKDLSHLRLLDLSYNRLTSLQIAYPFSTFYSFAIDVTHNAIGMFEVVPSGQMCARWRKNAVEKVLIRTGNNPVVCDCELYDLLRIYDERRDSNSEWCYRVDTDDLKCSDPAWLRGVPVANLGSKDFTCRREIDYSECPEDCECWWRPDDRTRLLNCSLRNLTEAPRLIGGSSNSPIEMNLADNRLKKLPSLNGFGYDTVTKLFLSHNNISNVSFDVVSPKLKVLQLEHNNLTSFDAGTKNAIKQAENLENVTLFDNPWDCGRKMRDFLAYIDQKYSMETTVSPGKQCLDQLTVRHRVRRRTSYITVVQF